MDMPEAKVPGEEAEEGENIGAEASEEDFPMDEAEETQESRPAAGNAPKQWGGGMFTRVCFCVRARVFIYVFLCLCVCE